MAGWLLLAGRWWLMWWLVATLAPALPHLSTEETVLNQSQRPESAVFFGDVRSTVAAQGPPKCEHESRHEEEHPAAAAVILGW